MNSRLIASVGLGVAVLLGTSGCAMITPQATKYIYSPGEGVSIPDSGPLKIRNALILTEAEGAEGAFVAAILNDSDRAHTLTMEIGEGASAETVTVRVPANSDLRLGDVQTDPLPLPAVPGAPGSMVPVYFQSGDAEGVLYQVPVLDGGLEYYEDLLP